MPPVMFQPRALATSLSVVPVEGLVRVSGTGKLLDAFFNEKRLIPVGRTTSLNSNYNAGGKRLQKQAESLVQHWSGVKSSAVSKGFARSSFWSLYSADASGCRSLCTSRVSANQLSAIAGAGDSVEQATAVAADQVSNSEDRLNFAEAASLEAEENGEIDSSGDKETVEIVSGMDATGNA